MRLPKIPPKTKVVLALAAAAWGILAVKEVIDEAVTAVTELGETLQITERIAALAQAEPKQADPTEPEPEPEPAGQVADVLGKLEES
jgi:hypothetical protein